MEAVLTKVTIPTVDFKDVVSRAVKGSTFIPAIPLSCLMELEVKDGVLYARTTNNVNFLTTKIDLLGKYGANNEDLSLQNFKIVLDCKLLSTIVSKLDSKVVTLTIEGTNVLLQSNKGEFHMPIQTDASGEALDFPTQTFTPNGSSCHINSNEVRIILTQNKSCKAVDKQMPCLFNYYFGPEKVVTSDRRKTSVSNIKVSDRPILVSPAIVDLVPVVCSEEYGVDICQDDEFIMFSSPVGEVVGKKESALDLQAYPVEGILNYFNSITFPSVQFNRTMLLQALERCSVFSDEVTKNCLNLSFEPTNVHINAISTSYAAEESVNYIKDTLTGNLTEPVDVVVDGDYVKSIISACNTETLQVHFDTDAGLFIETPSASFQCAGVEI